MYYIVRDFDTNLVIVIPKQDLGDINSAGRLKRCYKLDLSRIRTKFWINSGTNTEILDLINKMVC